MIVRHTLFNLVGFGAPLLVAIFCIPPLIHGLGADRFGLLTLIWAVVSYFGIFDLGLGRALTQKIAVTPKECQGNIVTIIATAVAMLTALGVFAAVIMFVAAPWAVSLIPSAQNRVEVIYAVYAMAAAMPFIIITSAFRGVLEAQHAFGVINIIRLPMGIFTFAGPLLVVNITEPRLDYIAWTLALGRVVGCAAHGYFAWRIAPLWKGALRVELSIAKELFACGGWITCSNIVGPVMGYLDRFFVASLVSIEGAAHYATPQEIIGRLSIISGSVSSVVFPIFSQHRVRQTEEIKSMVLASVAIINFISLPICLIIALFSGEILRLWIGKEFADQASIILLAMSCGMTVNLTSGIPVAFLQATNPKTVAIIHIIELPLFIVALVTLLDGYGIHGAVIAWTGRIVFDAILLWAAVSIRVKEMRRLSLFILMASLVIGASIYITATITSDYIIIRIILAFFFVLSCAWAAWINVGGVRRLSYAAVP